MRAEQLQKAEALLDDAEAALRPMLAVLVTLSVELSAMTAERWVTAVHAVAEARGIAEARIALADAMDEGEDGGVAGYTHGGEK